MNLKAIVGVIVFGLTVSLAWKVTANNPIFFGDPFPNLTTAELNKFTAGKDEFMAEEGMTDGLVPVFNGKSCAECHSGPAAGGDSEITETRFGTVTNGHFDPLTQFGGSLIQSRGIGGEPGAACDIAGETVPSQATEVALRRTPPLFGLGLVDAVPIRFLSPSRNCKRNLPLTSQDGQIL